MFHDWCKNVLHTLLLCSKYKESPLSLLNDNLLSKIYAYAIGPSKKKIDCPSVCLTMCTHEYHLHCFNRWKEGCLRNNRVETCPLDNYENVETFEPYYPNSDVVSAKLVGVGIYKESYQSRLKKRRLLERLDAQVMRHLKKMHKLKEYTLGKKTSFHSLGLSNCVDKLEQLYNSVYAEDVKQLQTVLDSLVKRGFVNYNSGNGTYTYNP